MSTHRITISLEDLPADLLRRIAELPDRMLRGITSGQNFGRALLVKKSPTDQGQLRNSWRLESGGGGAAQFVQSIVNDAPYAGVIERGARPHPVSKEGIESIAGWVWRNRGKFSMSRVSGPVRRGTGGRRALQRQTDMMIATQIAHAIAWKIRRYGQKPTWFVRESVPRITRVIRKEVAREIDKLAGERLR